MEKAQVPKSFTTETGLKVSFSKLPDEKVKHRHLSMWISAAVLMLCIGVWIWQSHPTITIKSHAAAAKQSCSNPTIKGNISYTTGEKIYHVPGDRFYDRTIIDTGSGERMFCTTQEAKAAGWRPSGS